MHTHVLLCNVLLVFLIFSMLEQRAGVSKASPGTCLSPHWLFSFLSLSPPPPASCPQNAISQFKMSRTLGCDCAQGMQNGKEGSWGLQLKAPCGSHSDVKTNDIISFPDVQMSAGPIKSTPSARCSRPASPGHHDFSRPLLSILHALSTGDLFYSFFFSHL